MPSQEQNSAQVSVWRDLAWVIDSPWLMIAPDEQEQQIQGIELLDYDAALAQQLVDFLHRHPCYRVGDYFETLIRFWLEQIRQVKMLGYRWPIRNEQRTLGELDFLFENEQGAVEHWEVAVKFYLYWSTENCRGSHFVGPNAADYFEKKRDRLWTHQLPLSQQTDWKVSKRTAFVKGRIFYPPNLQVLPSLPRQLSSGHLRGLWLRASQVETLPQRESSEAVRYVILRKPNWLSDVQRDAASSDLLTFSALKNFLEEHFQQTSAPVLLAVVEESAGCYRESERVFIVSESWPE